MEAFGTKNRGGRAENLHEFAGKNVEIVSIIFDEENSIVKIGRDNKDFSKLPEGNMYYANLTSLHPGKYKCRLVIRNPETGRGAVASSSVFVPKGQDHGIKLYPPLLLKTEKNAFYSRELSAVYPFDSSQYFPLVGQLKQGTNSVLAAVRCSFSGIQTEGLESGEYFLYLFAEDSLTQSRSGRNTTFKVK